MLVISKVHLHFELLPIITFGLPDYLTEIPFSHFPCRYTSYVFSTIAPDHSDHGGSFDVRSVKGHNVKLFSLKGKDF